ncbi:MAG: hypothetical protein DLM72_07875 [Candidatus Nitrosopolaris wilkensis]|nr:MAG: hypothetical protein DLM72_07875 [Candidatus Nitrosopolaris wilkensis]
MEIGNVVNSNAPSKDFKISATTKTSSTIIDGPTLSSIFAIKQIRGGDIAVGAISSGKIAKGTIGTANLADNSVTSAKIAPGGVTSFSVNRFVKGTMLDLFAANLLKLDDAAIPLRILEDAKKVLFSIFVIPTVSPLSALPLILT